jgi:hypothetical protein
VRLFGVFVLVFSVLLALSLPGCGEGEDSEPTETTEDVAEEIADEETVEEDVVEEVPLYPEGTVDPSTVTPGTVVSASALYDSYFAWNGKQVTVAAYPYIWYGDSTVVEDDLDLVADPESTDGLATAVFAEPPNVSVVKGELLVVTGTLERSWTGDIEITGAAMLEAPEQMVAVETSPYSYDGTTPIPVDELYEMVTAWDGKEVVVEGYYHSTTTSTTDYGTTVRVDLAHPDDIYTKYVACEMTAEIPEESESMLVSNREGVQVRGAVAGESFDMVGLEGCTLVNR